MSVVIYHNPRCSKSRATLQLIRDQGIEPVVIEYLKNPPDSAQLDTILQHLGLEPRQLMRCHEAEYKDSLLDNKQLDRAALIQAMVDHPRLIERPIVVAGEQAAIGRPPENVLKILPSA